MQQRRPGAGPRADATRRHGSSRDTAAVCARAPHDPGKDQRNAGRGWWARWGGRGRQRAAFTAAAGCWGVFGVEVHCTSNIYPPLPIFSQLCLSHLTRADRPVPIFTNLALPFLPLPCFPRNGHLLPLSQV